MNSTENISYLINSLTKDEDLRQDVWVYYLSGNSANSFESYLSEIKEENEENEQLQFSIWNLLHNPEYKRIIPTIEQNFSDYERSIICYLMLGLSINRVSNIKGISEVRIKQSIAAIRYNSFWKEAYGIKKEPIRTRETRPNGRRD